MGRILKPNRLTKTLRAARRTSGLSLRQLSRKTGLAYGQISNIETGYIKQPSFRTMVILSSALDLELDDLARMVR